MITLRMKAENAHSEESVSEGSSSQEDTKWKHLLVLRHSFPKQHSVVEMWLNQGFVDKKQCCWMGEQIALPV